MNITITIKRDIKQNMEMEIVKYERCENQLSEISARVISEMRFILYDIQKAKDISWENTRSSQKIII